MKRLISIILSALILITGMTCTLLTPVSALTPVQTEAYFENPDNWKLDKEDASAIADASTSTWPTITQSSVTVGSETVDAINLHTKNHRTSIFLPDLKKNTEYTFSFRYYSVDTSSLGGDYIGVLKESILFTPSATDAKIGWNTSTFNGVKEYISYNGRYKWNDDCTSTSWNGEAGLTSDAVAGVWNTVSYTFNTGSYNDYALVLVPKVDYVYLDNFALAAKPVTTEEYFNNPDNWNLDGESSTTIANAATATWTSIVKSSLTVGDETVDTLKLHSKNHRASIFLPDLSKNTEYTLSFRYYSTETTVVESKYNVIFKDAVLFTPSFENAKIAWNSSAPNGVKEYISYNGRYKWNDDYSAASWNNEAGLSSAAVAGEWNTLSYTFNTGNYDDYALVLLCKTDDIYLNGFSLTKKEVTTTEYFEDPDNWIMFNDTARSLSETDKIAAKNPNSYPDIRNSTDQVVNGEQSLYLFNRNKFSAIYLPENLKANTTYTLSYSYYTPELTGGTAVAFNPLSLCTTDLDSSGFFYNNPGVLYYKANNVTYTSANGVPADKQATYPSNGENVLATTAGEWHNVTITFNTSLFETFALVFETRVEKLYLDNFELTEYKAPQTTLEYFEDPTNWQIDEYIDKSQENTVSIGYKPCSWRTIVSDTTTTNESDTSLKLTANNGFTSIYMPDGLKENTDYTLSFQYYVTELATYGEYTFAFDRYGIYAADAPNACFKWAQPGFLNYVSYNGSYYSSSDFTSREYTSPTTSTKEAGKWVNVELKFNTYTFKELALVLQTKVNTVYLDNFAITEGIPEEETFHDGAQEQIIIDFEREWDYILSSIAGRMGVTETTDKDGNTTKALQIYEGDYTGKGVTFLNWATVDKGTDPVFSIPVKGGQTYEFSVDVKMSDYDKETDARLLLYSDYPKNTALMQMIYYADENSGVGEGWITYTYKFTTDEDATVASFGLNAGLKHPEIWVDNLVLTESEPEPPFHDGETDPIVIDFEREYNYFSGNGINRMEVAETTGMDGETTKALHIFEGDYVETTEVTFVNWSAVVNNSDPVFTVPVKGRTPYKISAKVKIEDWKNVDNSRLFLFYYDYNNRDTSDKSLVRGYYKNLMDQGWVEYSIEILTEPGQDTISFGINAGLSHPEIWIDDITVDAYERGLMGETDATYVENEFNLITESGYKKNGTVTQKTVMEIPVSELTKHTLGITVSGSGKVQLAFEKDGSDLIQTITCNKKNTRYGYEFLTGEQEGSVYLIFEPDGGSITYSDLYLFASKAVSFGTDMGQTEDPNTTKTPTYEIKYIGADDALGKVYSEGSESSENESSENESPKTGDSSPISALLLVAGAAVAALIIFGRKNKYHA